MKSNTVISIADVSEKPRIAKLFQLYAHDFSEFIDIELNENAEYTYSKFDDYWTHGDHHPFLIRTEGKISGFAFVKTQRTGNNAVHSISEYFIVKKYRKNGLGKQIAHELFALFPGNWSVSVRTGNGPALLFWQKVIAGFTKGNYTKTTNANWDGPVFLFDV